jgi:hypothetical protein
MDHHFRIITYYDYRNYVLVATDHIYATEIELLRGQSYLLHVRYN